MSQRSCLSGHESIDLAAPARYHFTFTSLVFLFISTFLTSLLYLASSATRYWNRVSRSLVLSFFTSVCSNYSLVYCAYFYYLHEPLQIPATTALFAVSISRVRNSHLLRKHLHPALSIYHVAILSGESATQTCSRALESSDVLLPAPSTNRAFSILFRSSWLSDIADQCCDYQHDMPVSPIADPRLLNPYRPSNLYQYHNAPEVLPASGLEQDDTIHTFSDKYTVQKPFRCDTRYDANSPSVRPPLIIFGMKPRLFLIVTAIIICVLVASSVGGAVGGRNLRGASTTTSVASNTTSASATTTSTTSVSKARTMCVHALNG